MELATAALDSLLPKLRDLLESEYKLQKGLRGEIRFLQAEMESMQAAINSMSKLPAHQIDDLDKIWVRDLRELVYDIEDSVDSFKVRVDDAPVGAKKPRSIRSFFGRASRLLMKAKNRHHIADDIQGIKKRIEEVAGRRERHKIQGTSAPPDRTDIDPRVLASFQHAEKLVGTDGPAEEISNLLMQGKCGQEQKLMVVSIVGVGGLGKTTIANLVYNTLGRDFHCQAFVSVSLKPDMKKILSSILRQVTQDKCTNAGEKEPEELIRNIRKFIEDKRYFIVIDDVWDKEAWEAISSALIDSNHGSRVIVTTRKNDVADFCSVNGTIYELNPLSMKDSKTLLSKRIWNEENGIRYDLEEVTKKILNKCGGVPLAIITIASMLAGKQNETKSEWYSVYNSMGRGLQEDKTLDNTRIILYLSYSDLPSYLKPCLLYLSMFPEDTVIPRKSLVQLWVAEGFVVKKQGSSLYDVGENYFNELVNRSMIQAVGMNEYSGKCGCRVHDMILDLIISLSAQENFVTISDSKQLICQGCKIRRLSVQKTEEDSNQNSKEEQMIWPATVDMSHVRSLVAIDDAFQWMPPLSSFSALRVLFLFCSQSNSKHLKHIGSLPHLRYLLLGGDLEKEILEEIGKLKHLKVLDLQFADIEELAASIVQLTELECLLTGKKVKFPDGIGNLVALQELSKLNVKASPNTLAELGKLTELRMLKIKGLDKDESYMETFLQSLCNLGSIRSLYLKGTGICSLDCVSDDWTAPARLQIFSGSYITFSQLPRWFSSLSELSCLSIRINVLRHDDLQLLGALPVLRFLKLQVDGSTAEERLVIGSDQPFRSLTEFLFTHYTRCWLEFGQGAMPKLRRLELDIKACKREGGCLDVGFENLTSLKHVTVKVDCRGARTREVESAEKKIRNEINIHPNHPALDMSRKVEFLMITDEDKDDREASEES